MKINEIFYSLQGEGQWAGLPNIFIRASGCNLRCSYCDTKYAYDAGKEMTIGEIFRIINRYPCNYICITGGEPLLQHDILKLLTSLLDKKYNICIETNGSINIKPFIRKSVMISLDIKCPSSGMQEKMNFANISYLRTSDQLKFIIRDRHDYDYAKKIIDHYKPRSQLFFQPVWGTNFNTVSSWILTDGLDVRLGLQLHKLLWDDEKKENKKGFTTKNSFDTQTI
jgi:7-carboxy-7-deazaguanine synthase